MTHHVRNPHEAMFTVNIQFGNADVLTYEDIANLLRNTAQRLSQGEGTGKIMDINGNTVGEFRIKKSLSWEVLEELARNPSFGNHG
jgi:hypothetical protein